MDEEFKSKLSTDHLERLTWFEDRTGKVSSAPPPLTGNRYLVSAPKGIFKPEGWDYALSIKVMDGSPYNDSQPIPAEGGGWLLSYQQEGKNPDYYTNAALRRCIRDHIPVGVLRKIGTRRRPSQYEVMGLALPVHWEDAYFFLESLSPRATWSAHPAGASFLPISGHYRLSVEYRRAALQVLGIAQTATVGKMMDALSALRVQRTADGRAKRHQPLTLLLAIGGARQRAARLVGWPAAREKIGALLQEFGETNRDSAYLPFLALAETGIWELTSMPPRGAESSARRRWLNDAHPVVKGGLIQPVYDLLAESMDTATEVAFFLLDSYFDDMTPAEILRLTRATGLEDLVGHAETSEPRASLVRSSHRGGTGRLADTTLRIAIENHAVQRAKSFYQGEGYEVTEVGKPYDLRAVRDGEELHVEVKGSTMSVDNVELTINEVRHAHEIRTDLYVVDQIQWEVQSDGKIRAMEGRGRRWPDWQPAQADLIPTRFRHRLLMSHMLEPTSGGL